MKPEHYREYMERLRQWRRTHPEQFRQPEQHIESTDTALDDTDLDLENEKGEVSETSPNSKGDV
jgi:hypothetical protein